MIKTFAMALLVVSMATGAAYAKGMHHAHHKHWAHCAQGMVKAACVCQSTMSKAHALCHKGQWCHPFTGACTQ